MNIIETQNLGKSYGNFVANSNINFTVHKGEIHAVVGENGAGKTTLMNMLYGITTPSSGTIYVDGNIAEISNPRKAMKLGIGMVHQHFKLIPSFSVYENILLGAELTRMGKIDRRREISVVDELIEKYHFDIDSQSKVQNLAVGIQQKVEILKMLYRNVDILILDEPTAVLTPQEADELLIHLKQMKKNGNTIIFITHKLREVMACAEGITVIRRGRIIARVERSEVGEKDIARMMVGRDVLLQITKNDNVPGKIILEANGLSTKNERGIKVLNNISFYLREGEILGVAGVEGNGQSELVKILTGMMKTTNGKMTLHGKDITNLPADQIRTRHIGVIPEDRYKEGLCRELSIAENLVAGYHGLSRFSKYSFFKHREIRSRRDELIDQYDIRVSDPDGEVGQLSGGNAQKIIIARELSMTPDVIIACQPTRGVDISSIEFIHKTLLSIRDKRKTVILISSELSEIMTLSDRIIVLYKGNIIGEVNGKDARKEQLGYLMTGITEESNTGEIHQ